MQHPLLGLAALLTLGLPPAAVAQDAGAPAAEAPQAASQAERIESAIAAYDEAFDAFVEAYQSAETEEARNKAFEDLYPDGADFAAEVLEAVELDPASGAAADGCAWLVENADGSPARGTALRYLTEHHVTTKVAGEVVEALAYSMDKDSEAFVQALLAAEPSVKVMAKAHMTMGQMLMGRHELAGQIGGDAEGMRGYFGAELIDELLALDEEGLAALHDRALEHFRIIVANEEMAAVRSRAGTIGEAAAAQIFEAENLTVGRVAPEVAGTDSADVEFKLSDYRGQVVLLDFWGDW